MTTQSGLLLDGPGKPLRLSDDIAKPKPGPKQALVKCLAIGIGPVELYQKNTGLLVISWPTVIGSDFVGEVTEVGPESTKLQVGDHVFGCAPLGHNEFTPFQDNFLVYENVVLRKPAQVPDEDACTIGVPLLTAALSLLAGAGMQLPEIDAEVTQKEEWVIILGGTGAVGQLGIQIARLCGFHVLASCSPKKEKEALSHGANATFDNRASTNEQLESIVKITKGNFSTVFDATTYGYELMVKALETHSTASTKHLISVDDWSPFNTPAGIKEYRTQLGHLCRFDEDIGIQVTKDIEGWIPLLEKHVERGNLKPLDHEVAKGVGWEPVVQSLQEYEGGKTTKKIVVRTQM